MNVLNRLAGATARSPIVWGLLGTAVFYGLIHCGPLDTPLLNRYFTHHPVEYAEALMFAIGLAALLLRMVDVMAQRTTLARWSLGPARAAPIEDQCRTLAGQLAGLPAVRQADYYAARLRSAVNYVRQRGSAEGLGDELKYLADADQTRAHGRYALFRVIVWAIPILGFLGTVIGITLALNSIDPKNPDESMLKVITGLGLKFDTTAVALSLSMLLMFAHFYADRAENGLLEEVDRRIEADLGGRFPQVPVGPDGQLLAVRRMAEAMVSASDRLIARQAELWQASMDAAAARWSRLAESAGGQLTKALTAALGEGLKAHALHLAAAEQTAGEQNRRQWDKLAQSQTQSAQALAALQHGLTQQAEVLRRAVEASGEVSRLEDALNRNLATLAGTKHFEQTVLGLAATINLLNARLSESTPPPAIQLDSSHRAAKAA